MASTNERLGVDEVQVRETALSMLEATESGHFDRISFRVNNKIFSTFSADKNECVLKMSLADQSALLSSDSEAFYEVGWAHQGWIGVNASLIDAALLQELMQSAWQNVAPKKLIRRFLDESSKS